MDPIAAAAITTAVAAGLSAAATIVLAFLTRGTWRLYQLERNAHRTSAARHALEVLREAHSVRQRLSRFGPETLHHGLGDLSSTVASLAKRTEWMKARLDTFRRLREATDLGPDSVSHLDVAYEVMLDAFPYWQELIEVASAGDDKTYQADRRIVMDHLRAVEGALASAYRSLPRDLRVWGADSSDYSEHYEAAVRQNASMFPEAHRYLRTSVALPEPSAAVQSNPNPHR